MKADIVWKIVILAFSAMGFTLGIVSLILNYVLGTNTLWVYISMPICIALSTIEMIWYGVRLYRVSVDRVRK